MKATILSLLAFSASILASGAFDVPRGVYAMDELEAARTKAAEESDPVSFLITRKSLEPT